MVRRTVLYGGGSQCCKVVEGASVMMGRLDARRLGSARLALLPAGSCSAMEVQGCGNDVQGSGNHAQGVPVGALLV